MLTLTAPRGGFEQHQRDAALDLSEDLLGALWQPSFPTADRVDEAADLIPDEPCRREPREGPTWRVSVSPGKVKVWTKDEADAERTETRQLDGHAAMIDAQAGFMELDANAETLVRDVPEGPKRSEITGWSAK